MKQLLQHTLIAATLVFISAAASAQMMPNAPPPGRAEMQMHQPGGWKQPDPAKMQAFFDKRMEKFKILLQLTAAQEGVWTSFAAAIRPPSTLSARPDRAEIEKMTTPERLDKLHALRVARSAQMDKREDATKTFYAALNPSQRKVFDMETLKLLRPRHMMQRLHNPMQGDQNRG